MQRRNEIRNTSSFNPQSPSHSLQGASINVRELISLDFWKAQAEFSPFPQWWPLYVIFKEKLAYIPVNIMREYPL